MIVMKKCIRSFKITIFLFCISSTVIATEENLVSVYLCLDSELILPTETLQEKVDLSKQLMAKTNLLVTDGKLLFFEQLYKNEGLFFSPVIRNKSDQFRVLTFQNLVVAVSIKNQDDVKNERYLCEFNRELSLLIEHFEDDWPSRLIK